MAANISSGNIGADVRNDIVWRKNWVARLKETEETFYKLINGADPPYMLFYSTDIQTGNINYQKETADLSITAYRCADRAWFKTMNRTLQAAQAVLDGLNATNKKKDWGLAGWPQEGVSGTNPFDSSKSKQYNIAVVFELVNQQGRVIGSRTVNLTPAFRIINPARGRISVISTENADGAVIFSGVKADDISDNMTIRVASVNGAPPQNAKITIAAISAEENILRIEKGIVVGFNSALSPKQKERYRNLVIPKEAFGEPVIAIFEKAFYNEQLTGITIPNSVIHIANNAFANNQLTNVIIPNSVTTIGHEAFADNQLTDITIPNSVTSIANKAFANNQLADVVIPNGVVSIGYGAFENNRLTGITIPNSVTSIANKAFANNQLANVVIPNNIASVGDGAFSGNKLSVIKIPNSDAVIDARNSQRYHTITTGNKTWMAQNLNYPAVGHSWCYENNASNCDKYGRLYDWYTATDVCPSGWHLPTRQEWNDLVTVAGGKDVAGIGLKAKSGWVRQDNKYIGQDIYGFSALPGGFRHYLDGGFRNGGKVGYWWTATGSGKGYVYVRDINRDSDAVNEFSLGNTSSGYSVRCIQNH
jgi:uncharacterized protein (TIGR02145 family)